MIEAKHRLIVALDASSVGEAEAWVETLGDGVTFYKIGMELIYGGAGLGLAERLIRAGKKVFIDLKLHDIPNTVERAAAQIAALGAHFLTVHAYPKTMRAAVAGSRGSPLRILGVSVLTSSDDADLAEAGYALGVSALVEQRARQAITAGLGGLVCAATEVAKLREFLPADFALVTPGIRPAGSDAGDQKRIAAPSVAIRDGADYLVVGRPITGAPDLRAAAAAIVAEMEAAARRLGPS